jgi:hypothetical protein
LQQKLQQQKQPQNKQQQAQQQPQPDRQKANKNNIFLRVDISRYVPGYSINKLKDYSIILKILPSYWSITSAARFIININIILYI